MLDATAAQVAWARTAREGGFTYLSRSEGAAATQGRDGSGWRAYIPGSARRCASNGRCCTRIGGGTGEVCANYVPGVVIDGERGVCAGRGLSAPVV